MDKQLPGISIQKKLVIAGVIAGITAIFLPWMNISAFGLNVGRYTNGLNGTEIVVFFLFISIAALSFTNSLNQPLLWGYRITGIIMAVLIIIFCMLWYFFNQQPAEELGIVVVSPGVGWLLAVISALFLIIILLICCKSPVGNTLNLRNTFQNKAMAELMSKPAIKTDSSEKIEILYYLTILKKEGHLTEEEYIKLKNELNINRLWH